MGISKSWDGAQLLGAYWLDTPDQRHGACCPCGALSPAGQGEGEDSKAGGVRGRVLMLALATACIVAAVVAVSV